MKRFFMIAAVAVASMALLSCEKYEDGKPAKDVRAEFKEMYPDAKDVEWEGNGGFWVVSFETGTPPDEVDHEAWYDKEGNWVRTETEILANALPQSVKDALAGSEYATAVIDNNDIVYVETPTGNFYRLELNMGGLEIHVDVTADGKVSLSNIGF